MLLNVKIDNELRRAKFTIDSKFYNRIMAHEQDGFFNKRLEVKDSEKLIYTKIARSNNKDKEYFTFVVKVK